MISGFYMMGLISVIGIASWLVVNVNNYDKVLNRFWIFGVSIIVGFIFGVHLDRGQEYQIKLLNQNTVEIKSMSTGKIYYCEPEKITETIDKDNL